MLSLVQLNLPCSQCGKEQEHTALMAGSDVVRALCNGCGNQIRGQEPESPPTGPSTRESALPAVFPFGSQYLGGGRTLVEGRLTPPAGPMGVQHRSTIACARQLARTGADFFRLEVTHSAQLTLIRRVKEATGLPVVADLGQKFPLVREALGAGANGIGLTAADAGTVTDVLPYLSGAPRVPLFVRVVASSAWPGCMPRAAGELLARQALAAVSPLRNAGAAPVVLSVTARHFPVTLEAYRILAAEGALGLRLEYHGESDLHPTALARHSVALSQLVLVGQSEALAVHLGDPVQSVEAARTVLDVVREARTVELPVGSVNRVEILEYLLRKAVFRVATKPLRMFHQWESDPRFLVRTLPARMITKPTRVLRELRRAARRIS